MSITQNMNPLPPKQSFLQILQAGQYYRKTFPMQVILAPVFKEFYIIKMTNFAIFIMPPLAVFSMSWALLVNSNFVIATTAAMFALSIAFQFLYWLGKRALSYLPLGLVKWLENIHHQLTQGGIQVPPLTKNPTYQELANILNIAFAKLDKTFLEDL